MSSFKVPLSTKLSVSSDGIKTQHSKRSDKSLTSRINNLKQESTLALKYRGILSDVTSSRSDKMTKEKEVSFIRDKFERNKTKKVSF